MQLMPDHFLRLSDILLAGQKEQVTQIKNNARMTKQVTGDNCHGHLSPLVGHFDFWSDKNDLSFLLSDNPPSEDTYTHVGPGGGGGG